MDRKNPKLVNICRGYRVHIIRPGKLRTSCLFRRVVFGLSPCYLCICCPFHTGTISFLFFLALSAHNSKKMTAKENVYDKTGVVIKEGSCENGGWFEIRYVGSKI